MSAQANAERFPVTDRDIAWKPFGDYEGFDYRILDVDVKRRTVEMMLRFEPDGECFYHRHHGPVASVVLEGEHHMTEVHDDGTVVKKVRTAGEYTMSHGGHAHIEGGGSVGGVIFFSLRSDQDHIYDIMDPDLNVVRAVTVQDFKAAMDGW
ncbi:MAG: hypothetical protein AAF458_07150 [Pseudomonadota bacterium]